MKKETIRKMIESRIDSFEEDKEETYLVLRDCLDLDKIKMLEDSLWNLNSRLQELYWVLELIDEIDKNNLHLI